MSDHQDHLDQQSAAGLLPMAPPSAGMPRLRGRIHLQDDDKPVDEKQQQDQLRDVLQAKHYRSILIARPFRDRPSRRAGLCMACGARLDRVARGPLCRD